MKAAPERVRHAGDEEQLSISGWLDGITEARKWFEKEPNKRFIDLTKDTDEIPMEEEHQGPSEPPTTNLPQPTRRVRYKTSHYPGAQGEQEAQEHSTVKTVEATAQPTAPTTQSQQPEAPTTEPHEEGKDIAMRQAPEDTPVPEDQESEEEDEPMKISNETKRAPDDTTSSQAEPVPKRTRIEMLDLLYAKIESLSKRRTAKECRLADIRGKDHERFLQAIQKEINNNLATGAYKIMSINESQKVRKEKEDKIMRSRYVFNKKSLDPTDVEKAMLEDLLLDDSEHGPAKAKCRHCMMGFSEPEVLNLPTTAPQVSRDGVIFVAQMIVSHGWDPGFLDFTQAFHSGDPINRELYAEIPKEGIPGVDSRQLLKFLKTCYGLTDGPFAWYEHITRILTQELGYHQSKADPCIFQLYDDETS